jgi:hypothetical protein
MNLYSFLKIRKQDFEGAKKWLSFIKTRNTLVQKQQGYFNYLRIMVSQTNINQAEIFQKQLNWDYLWIWT